MPNRASPDSLRRASGSRGAAARRAELITTAVALADRDGLDGVSIRRLAEELGTRPMTLYSYVASKEDLLELMAEQIVGEVLIRDPLPHDWRAALEMIALRSHEVFIAHPWVLAISRRRANLGRNALRHAEQLLAAVAPLELSASDSWEILFVINDYTLGHALRIAHTPTGPPNNYPEFDPADYPYLAHALNDPAPRRDTHTFSTGLHILLNAIEQRYAKRAN